MSLTTRIRIELLWGPLMPAKLARRLGMPNSRGLHAYLYQLCRAKKDPVIRVPGGYVLKRAYTALREWR